MAELRTIARPYAKAAFNAATSSGQLTAWADSLQLLAQVAQTAPVAKLIVSPSLTAATKAKNLANLCGENLSSSATNFIHVLAENKRLGLLPEIYQLFFELKSNLESRVSVVVNTAFPLDESAKSNLVSLLKDKLQCEVSIESVVDKSLLGGVLINAGDIVIDNSVKGRLAKLAEAMNS